MMIAGLFDYLLYGPQATVIGSYVPWTEDRIRAAEIATEHYLYGTVTVARTRPLVRDDESIAQREARLLAMDRQAWQERRRIG